MTTFRHWSGLAATLTLALGSALAHAQTVPTMKMTTPLPESITTPGSVETRLGTLKFVDGSVPQIIGSATELLE